MVLLQLELVGERDAEAVKCSRKHRMFTSTCFNQSCRWTVVNIVELFIFMFCFFLFFRAASLDTYVLFFTGDATCAIAGISK